MNVNTKSLRQIANHRKHLKIVKHKKRSLPSFSLYWSWEEKRGLMIQSIPHLSNMVEAVPMALGCIAANETELLVFTEDVTADRSWQDKL